LANLVDDHQGAAADSDTTEQHFILPVSGRPSLKRDQIARLGKIPGLAQSIPAPWRQAFNDPQFLRTIKASHKQLRSDMRLTEFQTYQFSSTMNFVVDIVNGKGMMG
jgi:hypothetical protein